MDESPETARSSSARWFLSVALALLVVGSVAGHALGSPTPNRVATPGVDAPDAEQTSPGKDISPGQDIGLGWDISPGRDSRVEQGDADLDVDCNESAVRVTAPAGFEYTLQVSNVVVTASSTEVYTTATTESGNATVNLTAAGPVYAFASSDAGLVASAFENCAPVGGSGPNATTRTSGANVSVAVDCDASEVRVVAPADTAYTLRVSNVVVTATSTEAYTTAQTASGNATVAVGDGAIAAFVFASDGTGDGDSAVASAFENCGTAGPNREATATTAEYE